MEQLWSAEALRAHWILSPEEKQLLEGMSVRRRLVLGYYLKFFQRYAFFPSLSDPVPQVLAAFLGEQIEYDGPLPSCVPDRTDRHYRRVVATYLRLGRFDLDASAKFLDWLVTDVLPEARQVSAMDDQMTAWFLGNRLTCALKTRTSDAEAILRRFGRGQTHPVFSALLELGKAVKTIFLCRYLKSEELRREINSGLNVIERWNGVNDFVFYGHGNELSSNKREDQEISVLCLHLLQASMVYINTLMIQEVLGEPEWRMKMSARDMAALNPLPHRQYNPYGVFDLDMDTRLPLQEMRAAA